MIVVARRNYRSYGKSTGCVPGRKTTSFERRFPSVEKGVIERNAVGYIGRTFPASNGLDREVNDSAIGVSLSRKQCRTYLIRVVPGVACNHQRDRQGYDLCTGDWGIECVIHIIQISRMGTKIRHDVRISNDQPGRTACDG